jgi:hypothetical protein
VNWEHEAVSPMSKQILLQDNKMKSLRAGEGLMFSTFHLPRTKKAIAEGI